jgi:hypothetical protein
LRADGVEEKVGGLGRAVTLDAVLFAHFAEALAACLSASLLGE